MFSNARLYNRPDSPIYEDANEMEKAFDSEVSRLANLHYLTYDIEEIENLEAFSEDEGADDMVRVHDEDIEPEDEDIIMEDVDID
jgi:hypothetical protein